MQHNNNAHRNSQDLPSQQSNAGRSKRKIGEVENTERDPEEVTQNKRLKIAVEIKSRPELELALGSGLHNGLGRTKSVLVKGATISTRTSTHTQTQTQTISRARSQSQRLATPAPQAAKVEAVGKAENKHSPPTKSTTSPSKKPVNHHEKVVNGIKHELALLQPSAADLELKKDEKRKLRSQEDQWFKSELSAYLPEYDIVIGNIPKEESELQSLPFF